MLHFRLKSLFVGLFVQVYALDRNGCSALHAVAGFAEGSAEVVALLISRGTDVNLIDYESLSPLMWAAESGNLNVATVLLQAGADLNLRNQAGQTARMIVEQQKPKNLDSWRALFDEFEARAAEEARIAAQAAGKLTTGSSPRVPALRAKSAAGTNA
jgi:ankyrin repeat protein